MRSTGADRLVRARKARNGAGAKGSVKGSHDRGNWKQEDFDACDRHALRLACLREAGGAIPPAYSTGIKGHLNGEAMRE
ncbi:MAG: hypothetical protein DMG41_01015 [Acidobacteria bacterium]|nr:MAG: hypothetical protein AUH13_15205 [Acidobacteria bacterium 13_2_20CM_58_27]PYT91877.1 MAG: hypothetical protein DMG41_01015 [Acidobacteriota bacterium]